MMFSVQITPNANVEKQYVQCENEGMVGVEPCPNQKKIQKDKIISSS
jgi:hypothetical protein